MNPNDWVGISASRRRFAEQMVQGVAHRAVELVVEALNVNALLARIDLNAVLVRVELNDLLGAGQSSCRSGRWTGQSRLEMYGGRCPGFRE